MPRLVRRAPLQARMGIQIPLITDQVALPSSLSIIQLAQGGGGTDRSAAARMAPRSVGPMAWNRSQSSRIGTNHGIDRRCHHRIWRGPTMSDLMPGINSRQKLYINRCILYPTLAMPACIRPKCPCIINKNTQPINSSPFPPNSYTPYICQDFDIDASAILAATRHTGLSLFGD